MEKKTNQDPKSIFFSLTKIKSPKKKPKNWVFIVSTKILTCGMFQLATYFTNNYLKMTKKNNKMIISNCLETT